MAVIERIFRVPWSINCQEKFTYQVCGKYVVKRLIFHLFPKLNFPSRRQFSQDILLGLMEKTNELYIVSALVKCHSTIVSFDLWMFKGAYDVFALVINFQSNDQ
jgi:hypothetical protein